MNCEKQIEAISNVLKEIRDNQKAQLKHLAESLAIQKEHLRLFLEQRDKTQRIQERAEAIALKSAQTVSYARKVLPVILVMIALLLAYITWLLWRLKIF